MMEPEPTLLPFEEDVQAKSQTLRRKARREDLLASLKRPFLRVTRASVSARLLRARLRARQALREIRTTARRTSFEIGAAAHSSATLSGVSKDAERVGAKLKGALAKNSATVSGLRQDLGGLKRATQAGAARLAGATKRAAARVREGLLRSSTVSGLAIDSHRVVKRVRRSRAERRGRFAH